MKLIDEYRGATINKLLPFKKKKKKKEYNKQVVNNLAWKGHLHISPK